MEEHKEDTIEKQQEIQDKETDDKKEIPVKKIDVVCNSNNSLNWLVHQFFVRGEYSECIEVLSKYSKNSQDFESAYSLLIKGLIQRSAGLFNDCQKLFKQSFDLNENSIYVLKEIGKTSLLLGKYQMAIDIYDSLLAKNEEDWDSYYHKGVVYFNMKNYQEANASLEKALSYNQNEDILIMQGKVFVQMEKNTEAIEKFEEALDICPNDSDILTAIGTLYLKTNNSDKAFDYFTESMDIDKKYSNSLLGLASIYQYQGEYEEALYQYKIGFTTNSNSPLMWNNLGLCFFAKNKNIAATSCLKKAIYFDPFEWIIAFNLGLVYLSTNQYASAFIYMNAAANLKTEYPLIFMYLGIILSELDDIYNAIAFYDKALKLKESYIIYFNYTVSLVKNDMISNAKEKFNKFRELYQKERNNGKEENTMIEEMLPDLMKLLK